MRRLSAIPLVAVLMVSALAAPAAATVDEIVGAWCSGQQLAPPGISDETKGNLARPLFASKVIKDVHFDAIGHGPGPHAVFDFDRPNIKLVPSGGPINVGTVAEPFYVDGFKLDPDFPAFRNCPNLLELP